MILGLVAAWALLSPGLLAQRGDVEVLRVRSLETPVQGPARAGLHEVTRPDLLGGQRPAIMLTGYWPPTNEMLRKFSDDPVKNPGGWVGEDWEGRGYDVYAYFPEFVPPVCVDCGQGMGLLEVDYQDTSADFWPLADALQPVAVLTFSRGLEDNSWEIEMNQFNRPNWIPDYTNPKQPTPAPPDGGAPNNFLRPSNLPAMAIVDAVSQVGGNVDPWICFTGDGGGFLSEFIAYHGVWYRDLHDQPSDPAWCLFGGHVHVGSLLSIARARASAEATLRTVIDELDGILSGGTCQADLGFAGPGSVALSVCGDPLETGGLVDLQVTGAAPLATLFLTLGASFAPTPFKGGLLVPVPVLSLVALATDDAGQLSIPGIPGGGGPFTGYMQAVVVDAGQPAGFALSNALELDFLP